jgi:hypothetical protein
MRSTLKDLTGLKIGQLEVLGYAGSYPGPSRGIGKSNVAPFWFVRCACGNEIKISGKKLRGKDRKSCGCLEHQDVRIKTIKQAARTILKQYKTSAKKRSYEWGLTEEEFFSLITLPCHYSGIPPKKLVRSIEGDFYWNGIDRVDNAKGYTLSNCVPCSDFANAAKLTRPYTEFVAWLDQVAQFRSEQKALDEVFA